MRATTIKCIEQVEIDELKGDYAESSNSGDWCRIYGPGTFGGDEQACADMSIWLQLLRCRRPRPLPSEKASAFRRTPGIIGMLADPEIEAVHVCPQCPSFPVAKAALEAGKAVLCEKPLTLSVAEARNWCTLAAARTLANCVNHNLRYYPWCRMIRRMIEER